MAKINLLPWREERREQKKREFIAVSVGVAILGVVLSALVWMFFNHKLDDQNLANQKIVTANQDLERQLKELDGLQARREEIIERMKLIQDLQGVRPTIVHIFDEITKLTPANMYLTSFSRDGDRFIIQGKAQDPNIVSDFLRNLGGSPWFRNAFMNSFVVPESKAPQEQGSVLPRAEEAYGDFQVAVDLGEATDSAAINSQAPNAAEVAP